MKKLVVGLTLFNLIVVITGIGDRRHDFQHELQRFKPKTVHHQEAPPPPPDSLLPDEHPQVAEPELAKRTSLVKVIVPSVYKEWEANPPEWATDPDIQAKYNFSVFLYQKHHPNKPNYIAHNRGTEAGVYLRYIVDHYDNFPDIAVFVHADPLDHAPNWLEYVGCISPSATYININIGKNDCRSPETWGNATSLWVEQCWRDVLKTIWEVNTPDKQIVFNRRVPITRPLEVCFVCCQQFVLSRETMRRRPLHVWKALLHVIGEQPVCHVGEPDYQNLYHFHKHTMWAGPEPTKLPVWDDRFEEGYGAQTQGGAMEHLAHVVFGFHPLDMYFPDQKAICSNFWPDCPGSPCHTSSLSAPSPSNAPVGLTGPIGER